MTQTLRARIGAPFAVLAGMLGGRLPPHVLRARVLSLAEAEAATVPVSGRLWIDLPDDRVLLRRLSLPAGSAARWRERTEERLATLSPWAPGRFLWDAALLGTEPNGAAEVLVGLVQGDPLRRVEQRLAEAGRARLAAIRLPASRQGGAGDRPALWFRRDAVALAVLQNGLAAASLGLCVLGAGLTLWQARQAVQATRAADEAVATTARLLAAARQPGDAGQAALALLAERPPEASRALLLTLLARLLPDDSWATTLTIEGARFELSGHSARPEAIVPVLEADGGLEGVEFSASSSRDPETGLFTFTVSGAASPGKAWP